jgi:hypothetical protein
MLYPFLTRELLDWFWPDVGYIACRLAYFSLFIRDETLELRKSKPCDTSNAPEFVHCAFISWLILCTLICPKSIRFSICIHWAHQGCGRNLVSSDYLDLVAVFSLRRAVLCVYVNTNLRLKVIRSWWKQSLLSLSDSPLTFTASCNEVRETNEDFVAWV